MQQTEQTFWGDIATQLQSIGLQTATTAAQSVANKITGKITGDSQIKQDPSVVQSNPWDTNLQNLNKYQIAGISLPILLAGAAVIYFAVRK